jgi:hypothetical protein
MGRALLFAGLVAVAGYVVVTVVGAEMIPGYNHLSRPLSEMTAQGSATKPALDRWFILLDTMVIGFASVMPASVCTQNDGVATYVQRGAAFLALAGVLGIIMTRFDVPYHDALICGTGQTGTVRTPRDMTHET